MQNLRKKSYSILMNFVSVADFDFQSDIPKFTNGLYEESVVKKSGSTAGSICENIMVETIVFYPDMDKVNRLLNERLEVLNVNAVNFGFSIPTKNGANTIEIGKRCFQKIQNDYTILSYDVSEGAKIELSEDFYLSIAFSEELMKIKLNTKYDWQLKKKNGYIFNI